MKPRVYFVITHVIIKYDRPHSIGLDFITAQYHIGIKHYTNLLFVCISARYYNDVHSYQSIYDDNIVKQSNTNNINRFIHFFFLWGLLCYQSQNTYMNTNTDISSKVAIITIIIRQL